MKNYKIFICSRINEVTFPYQIDSVQFDSNQFTEQTLNFSQNANIIGIVTKLQGAPDHQIIKIQDISRYGCLLKVEKQMTSQIRIVKGKPDTFITKCSGLVFARFKIISVIKKQNYFIGNIQILSDQIQKKVMSLEGEKKLIVVLHKQISFYYDQTLDKWNAIKKKQMIINQNNLNKIIYMTISQLKISLKQKLQFLEINNLQTKVNLLLKYLSVKQLDLKPIEIQEEKVDHLLQELLKTLDQASSKSRNHHSKL